MLKFNRKTVFLIALPLVLSGLILYAQSRKPRLLPGVGGSITAIAFSPDSQNIVCASNNNYVQIWLPERERWRSFYNPDVSDNGMPGLCVRVRFSSDGKTLYAGGSASGGSQTLSQAWDVATRRRKFAFGGATGPVFDITSDGRWAAISYKNNAYLMDLKSKPMPVSREKYRRPRDVQFFRPRRLPETETGTVTSVAFSPDGKTLAIADSSQLWQPKLWSVETAKPLETAVAAPNASAPISAITATFLEWSPDEKRLAAAGNSGITIYDIEAQSARTAAWPTANSLPNQSAAYMGGIIPIAWSPDGKTIFTGGDEVRRWRARDLKLEYSYGVSGPVAVSPDGRTLATASRLDDAAAPKGVLLWKLGWQF